MLPKQLNQILILGVFLSAPAFAGRVELVSIADPAGSPTAGTGANSEMAVSGDGRWIAFASTATDLVPGQVDSPGTLDVFLRDRQTGTTVLVSHVNGSPSVAANRRSEEPVLSDDGRWLAYISLATNLVPGQNDFTNASNDVFLYDRATGTTSLASRGDSPTFAINSSDTPQISRDGRFVAYIYSQSSLRLFDRETETTQVVTPTSASQVMYPVLSADNSTVVFLSRSTSLVPGQVDTNGDFDMFAWDRTTATTMLVSRSTASPTTTGNGGVWTTRGGLSANGRYVLYSSGATDAVPAQVDTALGTDVFLFDRVTGTTSLVSRAASAGGSNTVANEFSVSPLTGGLDASGRWALFLSLATDLVAGVTDANGELDLFLYDRATGTTTLVTHRHGTAQETANGMSLPIAINETGTRILVHTLATDLIDGITDLNGTRDAYLYEVASNSFELISHAFVSHGKAADGEVRGYFMNRRGDVIAFAHDAPDLVPEDDNGYADVFAFVPEDLDFYTLEPCRLFDSRRPEDGPAPSSGFATVVEIDGACGIPATARALAVNLTVVQPGTAGYLTVYPGDGLPPLASSMNFGTGQTRTNNAVVRLAPSGNGTLAMRPVLAGGGSVHVVIDVIGYFE